MSDSTPPSLYAAREPIFPRRVSGKFRNLKWVIMIITLGIYYITPWLRWDRGPQLPDQAVLIDLANRRFFFFWIEIWPHEFYFVAGLLIMAGLGLFLFTSALGRVWCGYACPQTVWTDLFMLVDRRRPQRPSAAAPAGKDGLSQDAAAPDEMGGLVPDRPGHRRRLDLLLCRRADAADRSRDRAGSSGGIHHHADPDGDHLLLWWLRTRTDLHLCLPLAAYPGRHGGGNRAASTAKPKAPRTWATASTAWPASTSVRWGSTSATDNNWSVSHVRSVSTPATT